MKSSRSLSHATVLLTIAGTLWLNGCGAKPKAHPSNLQITNGREVKESVYPSVIKIKAYGGGVLEGCTATFVNHFQAVTAAHCLDGMKHDKPSVYAAKFDAEGNEVTSFGADAFAIHPLYDPTVKPNPYDLAVVNFPRHAASKVSLIASQRPALDVWVQLVGYGDNENFFGADGLYAGSGNGKKRVGTNKLLAYEVDMIRVDGVAGATAGVNTGLRSCTGSGDSGGPLFFNSSTLIGIVYGGGLIRVAGDDGAVTYECYSLFVDLNNEENIKFLDSTLEYE